MSYFSGKKWKPVKLEGVICNSDLDGLIGIEELCDYNIKKIQNNSTQKKNKKRLNSESDIENDYKSVKKQKIKSENLKPTNKPVHYVVHPDKLNIKTFINNKNAQKQFKKKPLKIEENVDIDTDTTNTISVEKCDTSVWTKFNLHPSIIKALGDLGFEKPTKIQELTLHAAILGKRDILGAAETGSGKTLAFGLPILNGILHTKEKNEHENDTYQKSSVTINSNFENSTNLETDENCSENSENSDEKIDNMIDLGNNKLSDNESSDEEIHSNLSNNSDEEMDSCNDNSDEENDGIPQADLNEQNNLKVLKPLYALILTPTRELAVQVKNHLAAAAKHTDIRIAVLVGGMASVKQERVLSKGPEIVVATPGRLWELIQDGNPHLSQIDRIKYLTIDETDRMIERGHFQELHHLLERLNMSEYNRTTRQTFIFSATLSLVHEIPNYLMNKKRLGRGKKIKKLTSEQKLQEFIQIFGISDPKIVDITQKTGTSDTLTECRIPCPIEEKDHYLYYFIMRHPGRTLVFCNSIGCVKRLTTLFTLLQCSPLPLHAGMQQRQRLKNLERFRDNPQAVLIATDVAARGLDIPQVQHVIHYQVPRTAENYVHRSGRTARAQREGIAVLIMEPSEVKNYVKLCRTLNRTNDLPLFPVVDEYLSVVKQRVNFARELDKLELQARRQNAETGWLQKAMDEMDIIVDDDDIPCKMADQERSSALKKAANVKRKQLNALLAKPLIPKHIKASYPGMNGHHLLKNSTNEETTNDSKDTQSFVSSFVGSEKSENNAVNVMKKAIENYARNGRKVGAQMQKNKTKNDKQRKNIKFRKELKKKNKK